MHIPGLRRLRAAMRVLRHGAPHPAPVAAPAPAPMPPQRPGEGRFETQAPAAQTIIDLWAGNWASNLGPLLGVTGTGAADLFAGDARPAMAARALGREGRLDGMRILELGPLEAGHTWQLQQLGAGSITAIEASAEAWLKCLALKELLDLSAARFLYGDCTAYLEAGAPRFDLVFASGVLYHLSEPLRLIAAIAAATDRCFVWTHYHDPARAMAGIAPEAVTHAGFTATHWRWTYADKAAGFWGGNRPGTSWLARADIIAAFAHFGLTEHEVLEENTAHPHGAAFTVAFRRPA